MKRAATQSPTREETLKRLRAMEPELRGRGIISLYLFGSVARDEARPDSDIDLFCDLDPKAKLGTFAFLAIADRLIEAMGRKVDLATRSGLHRLIRVDVENAAARVF